jgi:hypothetical protein
LQSSFGDISSRNWGREPLRMIRDTLRDDQFGPVGGSVQMGILQAGGFNISFDVQPVVVGQSLAKMTYRGFDVSEIIKVGGAFSTITGIA